MPIQKFGSNIKYSCRDFLFLPTTVNKVIRNVVGFPVGLLNVNDNCRPYFPIKLYT